MKQGLSSARFSLDDKKTTKIDTEIWNIADPERSSSSRLIEILAHLKPGLVTPRLHVRLTEKKETLRTQGGLSGEALKRVKDDFIVEFAHHNTAIDGNSLALSQARVVLKDGLTVKDKPLKEHLEVINQQKALAYIEELAKLKSITESDVLSLHGIVTSGSAENGSCKYRTGQVGITNARFLPPPAYLVPPLMQQFLDWVNTNPGELWPVEFAAVTHLWFVTIHPFWDANVRTAGLLMNYILLRNGYPMILQNSDDKQRYYRLLQAFQEYRMVKPFVIHVARLVEESLDILLQAAVQTTPETVLTPLHLLARNTPYTVDYWGLLARRGLLPAFKRSGRWYVRRKDVNDYLKRHEK